MTVKVKQVDIGIFIAFRNYCFVEASVLRSTDELFEASAMAFSVSSQTLGCQSIIVVTLTQYANFQPEWTPENLGQAKRNDRWPLPAHADPHTPGTRLDRDPRHQPQGSALILSGAVGGDVQRAFKPRFACVCPKVPSQHLEQDIETAFSCQ